MTTFHGRFLAKGVKEDDGVVGLVDTCALCRFSPRLAFAGIGTTNVGVKKPKWCHGKEVFSERHNTRCCESS